MKTTQDQIEKVSREYANQSCMMQGEMGFVVREWVSRGFKAGCNWMAGQTLVEERNGVKAKETASAGILTCDEAWTLYMVDKDYNTHTSDRAHWAFEFAWNMANASKPHHNPNGYHPEWLDKAAGESVDQLVRDGHITFCPDIARLIIRSLIERHCPMFREDRGGNLDECVFANEALHRQVADLELALHQIYDLTGEEAGDIEDFRALVDNAKHTVEAVKKLRDERDKAEGEVADVGKMPIKISINDDGTWHII